MKSLYCNKMKKRRFILTAVIEIYVFILTALEEKLKICIPWQGFLKGGRFHLASFYTTTQKLINNSIIPKVFRSEFFAISVILFEEMIFMLDIK